MRDKLIMLGYDVYEHNKRICIARNESKQTLLVIKDGKEISDCSVLDSRLYDINEIKITECGGLIALSIYYNNKSNTAISSHCSIYIDSYSNVIHHKTRKDYRILADTNNVWIAQEKREMKIFCKRTGKKSSITLTEKEYNSVGVLRTAYEIDEHGIFIDDLYIDIDNSKIYIAGEISICENGALFSEYASIHGSSVADTLATSNYFVEKGTGYIYRVQFNPDTYRERELVGIIRRSGSGGYDKKFIEIKDTSYFYWGSKENMCTKILEE